MLCMMIPGFIYEMVWDVVTGKKYLTQIKIPRNHSYGEVTGEILV